MSDFTERLRHWSHHRQLLGRRGTSPIEIVRAICGVYSHHPGGPLAIAARMSDFSPEAFRTLDQPGASLRLPAMRQSVYLLDPERAPTIVAAVLDPPDSPAWAKRYSQAGRKIPAAEYPAWSREIRERVREPQPMKGLKSQLTVPGDKLKFVLNRMCFERQMLRVGDAGLASNTIRYVSLEAWLGRPFPIREPEAALAELLRWYLAAFGPATEKDFRWWAGVTAARSKAAFRAHADLVEVAPDYWLAEPLVAEWEAHGSSAEGQLDVLPQWDSYTMGYAPEGRARLVDPDHQSALYGKLGATRGNGLGAILVHGRAQGVWFSRRKGKKWEVEVKLFSRLNAAQKRTLNARLDEIRGWLVG
ncbi:MAG: crosslink repair DNA glycosylase YcaQ family protein [Bacteroidota bacterium]